MNIIDFREHDTREQGMTQSQRVEAVCIDLKLAQRIRESLREQKEARAFAEADKRMRGGA
jgi:hypothetical protein